MNIEQLREYAAAMLSFVESAEELQEVITSLEAKVPASIHGQLRQNAIERASLNRKLANNQESLKTLIVATKETQTSAQSEIDTKASAGDKSAIEALIFERTLIFTKIGKSYVQKDIDAYYERVRQINEILEK